MAETGGSIHVWMLLILLLTSALARGAEPPRFALPIACQPGSDCFVQNYVDHDPSTAYRDYACGERTYDGHDGTDFRLRSLVAQRAGVAVLAAADGVVAGVRDGMEDVSIRDTGKDAVKGRECGNGLVLRHADGWETQYCHMAQGSLAVTPGPARDDGAAAGPGRPVRPDRVPAPAFHGATQRQIRRPVCARPKPASADRRPRLD